MRESDYQSLLDVRTFWSLTFYNLNSRSHFLLLHLFISSSVIVVGVPVGTVCLCISTLRQAFMLSSPSNV
jgi:hypothetical protein